MSRIDRAGNPCTGTLRRRLLAGAMAAVAAALTVLPARPVSAQDIVVSGGAVQSNSSPATYNSIDVSGTDGSSNPSTYNADAPLTLTGSLNAHDLGVFNVNADVSVGREANSYSGGVINLNAGTLMASWGLSFNGLGSVNQNGGNYSVDRYERLTLSNGAALAYGTGDTLNGDVDLASGATLTLARDLDCSDISVDGAATKLASSGYGISAYSLYVDDGATVTLDQNLTLTDTLDLWRGGSITRTSQTISASDFDVGDARLDLLAGDTFSGGYTNYVWDGGLVNAPAGTSLGDLDVYGTNDNGDRSTFNINGDVSLVGASAFSDGVINVNGNVSLIDAGAFSDGVINLNTGTLSAESLYLSGSGALNQNGGHYSIDDLALASGASLRYGTGDSITAYLSVYFGATLSLDQDLSLTETFYLGPGSSIARTTETISARSFDVADATLDLLAGDTFSPSGSSNIEVGALVNASAGTAIGYLNVTGTNGNGDWATFNVNGDVSLGIAFAFSNGVVNLNAGTLSALQELSFDGVGSVTRSAGSYSTHDLTLSNGATLGYGSGDSITNSVSLNSGAALTLAKDLNLSGAIGVDGAATTLVSAGQAISADSLYVINGAHVTLDQNLTLSGYLDLTNGGSINRTTATISALGFSVYDATFDLLAGDTFSPGSSSRVFRGALVNAPAGAALGSLQVTGTNGNGDRSTFNVNGDVTVTSAAVSSKGVLNLIAGTLSTPSLSLSGTGSAGQAGGHYDVTDLFLSGGATFDFGLGDSIDSLFISDAGSRLDQLAPLTLSSLSLSNGGVLHLGAFTGTGAIADWGLRMTGDDTVFLQGLIERGLLTAGLSPLSVIFDAGSNMTYVTAVPEIDPNTAHGAVLLLVGALGLLERRLRRSSGAVTLS